MIKKQIRVIGIDDAPFKKFEDEKTFIIGAVMRGSLFLDGVLMREIEVDGDDSSQKIVEMINSSKYRQQIKAIMLHGITFGGLNIADISQIHSETKLPVIGIVKDKPDNERMINAIMHVKNSREKLKRLERGGGIKEIKLGSRTLYTQLAGILKEDAKTVIKITTARGFTPEPIRAAHLIAGALAEGESRGRA